MLLIDGLNIVRRVYEANPSPDSADKAQAAMKNSLASFRRALKTHTPSHVLVPFDEEGPNWRNELYPAYHSSRKPMAAELRAVLPELKEKLQETLGAPTITKAGYEADDLIGTVVTRWMERSTAPVKILSSDKDLLYWVSLGALVRDHFADKEPWRGREYVMNKFGVPPELILDFHALVGDKVDDVPGVDKVGKVTASAWLNEYGSLEGVLQNADALKGKVGENLRKQTDRALLSRQLVAMKTDVPLGLTWNMLRFDSARLAH
ncbi:5'-3' exonuclease [Burkholderia cenocepacia]|uniref:5'-3' exonuclease n=1 Tax=Burkholderia cenocepacia TaxID=95486 RepID=UPI001F467983|nr:5'-3' exonuclease H3TH domain-containing protein [Burkholderia cenocepacia]